MIRKTGVEEFLVLAKEFPVLDVRSPAEYSHAHIPASYSFPLFTDAERQEVGTLYKQQGREAAIKAGLAYFGPKMVTMIGDAQQIVTTHRPGSAENTVLIHCWRGGMRSAGVAWLMDLYGFRVYTLSGGYKAFRNWVLQQFEIRRHFKIIGGYTGSGKTPVLKELGKAGDKTIDLEGIAGHKGSAFGGFGVVQPTQEMFENLLAAQLSAVSETWPENGPIWLEDESQRIGNLNLPNALWDNMRTSQVYFMEVPFEERLKYIVSEYGSVPREELIKATLRIRRRLGGLDTKNAINCLEEGNITACFRILLAYYDRQYERGLVARAASEINKVFCETTDHTINCRFLTASEQQSP